MSQICGQHPPTGVVKGLYAEMKILKFQPDSRAPISHLGPVPLNRSSQGGIAE